MKTFFKAILAVSAICFMALSCSKSSDTDGLQKQIDEIKSTEIATIQQQISGIKTSLASLETTDSELKGYIKTLQQQKEELEKADEALGKSIEDLKTELQGEISAAEANALAQLEEYKTTVANQLSAINTALTTLQNKDTDLQQQITTLKNYVENDLKTYIDNGDNSVKNWVSASFATLEQYNTTAGIVATIQEQITTINQRLTALEATYVTGQAMQAAISNLDESLKGLISQAVSDCNSAISTANDEITAAYTTAIQNAIASSESSIKTWVNNQLVGYYTIAQTDAKVKALEDAYKAADQTMTGEISSLTQELNKAKTDLTAAYQAAIIAAITENNGTINQKIADDIKAASDALQAKIDTINGRLDVLEAKVSALEATVAKLIAMVQSVVVVPDYTDGSVLMTSGAENKIRFEVYPLEAAAGIAQKGPSILSLDYVSTQTKSSEDFANLPLTAVEFTGKTLLLTVDGTNIPSAYVQEDTFASARLKISDGTTTKSSEYFPLYFAEGRPLPQPITVTGGCSDITEKTVTLFGWSNQIQEQGETISFGFEYSSSDLTKEASSVETTERDSDNKIICTLSNLSSATRYYFRAYTLYKGVRLYGEVKTFTTNYAQITTGVPTDITDSEATLHGELSVEGLEPLITEAWFLYSDIESTIAGLMENGIVAQATLQNDGTFESELLGLAPGTKYYYVANAHVLGKPVISGAIKDFTTLPFEYTAVDMGLSVKWGSCNLGASKPEEYGDYYAWGETEPYYTEGHSQDNPCSHWRSRLNPTISGYNWASYKWCDGSSSNMTKYNTVDNKTSFKDYDYEDDAARTTLGGKWRIPSDVEWDELKNNCTWIIIRDYNSTGIAGYLVTSNVSGYTDKSVFLPYAGRRVGVNYLEKNNTASYWSSSRLDFFPSQASFVNFSENYYNNGFDNRYDGKSIRPVSE